MSTSTSPPIYYLRPLFSTRSNPQIRRAPHGPLLHATPPIPPRTRTLTPPPLPVPATDSTVPPAPFPHAQTQSLLFFLPPELRLQIYTILLDVINNPMQLLRTSKRLTSV